MRLPRLLPDALRRCLRARAGNVAVIVALAVPVAATMVLGATDVASIMGDRERMRSIAESAALSGARSLSVAMNERDATAHAQAVAEAIVQERRGAPRIVASATIVELENQSKGVRVRLDATRPSFFNDLLPPGGWQYDVAATASSVGSTPLCVLSFGGGSNQDFLIRDSARLRAPECLVHSNADIAVLGSAALEAARTQAVRTATGDITPDPITDAPPIADPFANIALNTTIPGCVLRRRSLVVLNVMAGTHVLPAGNHCGLVTVGGSATVRLAPGEHRFALGALVVRDNARLVGDDVVLIFDKTWRISFLGRSQIALSGRESGLLAGFVLATDRDNISVHQFESNHIEKLEGVIYAPRGELRITSTGDVSRESAWTVIAASKLRLLGSPNLFVNADYEASDVDVPAGVGPSGAGVRLVD